MDNISIKVGDILNIAGVQYEVQHISSCEDCCLCNTRQCSMLDPAITCGEKTYLGFKTVGYNLKSIFDHCMNNRKQYKNNPQVRDYNQQSNQSKQNNNQLCKV